MNYNRDNQNDLTDPDLKQARITANIAHNIVIKFKEMELPETLDKELANISTDLGDLLNAQTLLSDQISNVFKCPNDWEVIANLLVDIRSNIEHIGWHQKNIRSPLGKIARYAYGQASQ